MKILITGSTQGIGRAMAKAFVERGDEVTVHCSGDIEKAKRVAAEIGAAHAVVADLSVAEEVNSLYSKTGPVDCLILNASVQYRTPWLDIEDYELDRQIDINFKSTFKLMQAYYPAMKEKGFGRIITVGSVNNIAPGVIATPRNYDALNDAEYAKKVMEGIPAGYAGEDYDCAGAALLLCSEAGRYITGTDIIVDGGMHL